MAGAQAKFPNMGKTGYASCLRNMGWNSGLCCNRLIYFFEPLPRNNATSNNMNTAPPTIQTHGCIKKLSLLPDLVLMVTSTFFSCAKPKHDHNRNDSNNINLLQAFFAW